MTMYKQQFSSTNFDDVSDRNDWNGLNNSPISYNDLAIFDEILNQSSMLYSNEADIHSSDFHSNHNYDRCYASSEISVSPSTSSIYSYSPTSDLSTSPLPFIQELADNFYNIDHPENVNSFNNCDYSLVSQAYFHEEPVSTNYQAKRKVDEKEDIIQPKKKSTSMTLARPRKEITFCTECLELLGEEIVHLPQTISTKLDWKFEEIELKFANWTCHIHDWKYFPPLRSGVDMYKVANYIVGFINKFVQMMDGVEVVGSEDHQILRKSAWEEFCILYSVMAASQNAMFWNLRDSRNKIKAIAIRTIRDLGEDHYRKHRETINSFPIRWRWDKKFMPIIFAITYYNPSRSGLLNSDLVGKTQNVFITYLQHYLLKAFGNQDDASMAFAFVGNLLQRVKDTSADLSRQMASSEDIKRNCPQVAKILLGMR